MLIGLHLGKKEKANYFEFLTQNNTSDCLNITITVKAYNIFSDLWLREV